MNRGTLISVIVPVYNVENYLEDCLNSIVHQSYADLEILVVDDGSKDGSPMRQICQSGCQNPGMPSAKQRRSGGKAGGSPPGIGRLYLFCRFGR